MFLLAGCRGFPLCSHPRRCSNVAFTCTHDTYSLHNSIQVGITVSLGNSSLKVITLAVLKWFSLAKRADLSQILAKSYRFLPVSETAVILMAFVFLQPLAVAPGSADNLGPWHLASFMENLNLSPEALWSRRNLSVRTGIV